MLCFVRLVPRIETRVLQVSPLIITMLIAAAPASAAEMSLFDSKSAVSVVYDNAGGVPIAKAAELLRHDLTALTGTTPAVSSDFSKTYGAAVIIGVADSPHIAAILKA